VFLEDIRSLLVELPFCIIRFVPGDVLRVPFKKPDFVTKCPSRVILGECALYFVVLDDFINKRKVAAKDPNPVGNDLCSEGGCACSGEVDP